MSQASSSSKRGASEVEEISIFKDENVSQTSKKACAALENGPSVTSEPVSVLLGEEKEKFFVHAHLLETSSEYFRRKLSSVHDGPMLRTVNLPDVDANAFRLYAKWLYTGRFHLSNGPATHIREGSPTELHWDEISACYALSASLEASAFGDATIDVFIRRMEIRNDSPIDLAKWIYPRTTEKSAHRNLCRDIVVHTWDRKNFDRLWKEDYPKEFLENVFADVSLKLERGVRCREVGEFLESKHGCMYHEHKRLALPCYKLDFGT